MRGALLPAALLALLPGLAAPSAAPQGRSEGEAGAELTGREGSLRNDALVPGAKEVAERLAQGDEALGELSAAAWRGGAPPGEADRRALLRAATGWSEALKAAPQGEAVPVDLSAWLPPRGFRWPDPDGTAARRHEAIEEAVLRRLALLPPTLRGVWTGREGPAAEEALALAGPREPALARVEHLHPGTRGAALASLRLFELAFERGRPAIARSWLERAAAHARVAGGADVEAALAPREARLAALAPPPPPAPLWDSTTRVRPAGEPRAVPPSTSPSYRSSPATPGLAHLSGGRLALRHRDVVWIADPTGRERGFEPQKLFEAAGLRAPGAVAGPDAPWLFAPASDGERLYLVEGRAGEWPRSARPEGAEGSWHSNALLGTRPPAELDLPTLVWALGPEVWQDPDGRRVPLAEALAPGMWEFQPGPALVGSLLLVQARQWAMEEQEGQPAVATPSEARLWVLALDAGTGAVVWKRFLALGTDLVPDLGLRFRRNYLVRTAAQPLVVAGGRAFVPTSLGLGLLVDLADGRLVWSFANRRRAPEERGWRALRPPPVARGLRAGRPVEAALFAPPDSDRLYWLRLERDLDGAGPLLHPPQPMGEAEELVGGDLERAYVLGRSGARRTFSSLEPRSGRRLDSIYLGRDEEFVPGALAGERRALFATDRGLYLLDLERELYLVQHLPLELDLARPSGGLFARGGALWLLAERKLRAYAVD